MEHDNTFKQRTTFYLQISSLVKAPVAPVLGSPPLMGGIVPVIGNKPRHFPLDVGDRILSDVAKTLLLINSRFTGYTETSPSSHNKSISSVLP